MAGMGMGIGIGIEIADEGDNKGNFSDGVTLS